MNIKTIPDQIVLNSLKNISYGKIQFINYDGKKTLLGKDNSGKTVTLRLKKPGLTFEIINKGSTNANRCSEIAMGSPLTEKEKNATKKSENNSECPSIANPNYVPY